jgi:flagellar basal body-associated protein FliL
MSDKDQFTFEDEDESPERSVTKKEDPREPDSGGGEIFFDTEDLSGTSLGEQADTGESDRGSEEFFFDTEEKDSGPELETQPELGTATDDVGSFSGDEDLFGDNLNAGFPENDVEVDDPVDFAPEPQEKSGGSRSRTLLMVLLLVIVVAGGAYYFMGLGSSTPSVPTVKMPVETPAKVVAVPPPPPPAKAPAVKAAPEKEKPVSVAVPPPPAPAVVKAEAKPAAAAAKPAPVEKPKQEPAKPASTSVAVPAPVPAPVPVKPAPAVTEKAAKAPPVKAEETPAVKTMVTTKPAEVAKPVAAPKAITAPKQIADGAYALDAGSYLMASNRKALVAKLEKLGYQPLVTPVDATINMTRLRLGTHNKEDVKASLAFAREIEPGSYSVPAGDGYVIYAGTFLKTNNLEKIKKRFLAEGVQVKSEPVQVVRTLSRVRFGSFASKEDAADAASIVAKAGVKAAVVKAN